jgi:hypothetical protein
LANVAHIFLKENDMTGKMRIGKFPVEELKWFYLAKNLKTRLHREAD